MSNPTLRNLLARPGMLVAPGAYDALGARMIEPQERSGEEVARQLEQVASSAAEIAKKAKVKPE